MEEKREEDFEEEFDDEELDLTKDAFFSNLMEMEEEIVGEAYELVEHAINLIESKFYDDSIEVLRQAIGLYTQINREQEIKAINEKISEIYVLKEKEFREIETQPEKEVEVAEEPEVIEEVEVTEEVEMIKETKVESDLVKKADQLIVEAHQLSNINRFEEALDKYDEAEKILENLGRSNDVERIYSLIEDCYNKKAEYLRSLKKKGPEEVIELQKTLKLDHIKERKLTQFLETKKREEELSSRAYEILDQAAELAKKYDYEQAIKLYEEGVKLFEELSWVYEAKRIQDTIEQLQKERIRYYKGIEKEKLDFAQKIETELQKEETLEQYVKVVSEKEKLAQMERVREVELQKMEQEFFKAQIDNMATEAGKMARNYELAMQKAIKKGNLLEECIYPKVIEIYKRIKELLIDKGWNNEATIYDDTINIYIQKFEQDKKVRQIEADKIKRQQETEEILKIKKEDIKVDIGEVPQRITEPKSQEAIEIQTVRNQIDEITRRAERLARDYEVALRQGKFELKCPYPEIINIFENAKKMALERGWETDVAILSSQIYNYKEKLKRDNRLRQIEAEKVIQQEEIYKVKKEEPVVSLESEKLKFLEEERKLKEEEEDFDSIIDVMLNRAENMAREYELAMKKAIKKGKLAENPPFLKIIGIYERINRMLLDKGRRKEAAAYSNQINFYAQKLEQDNKLRKVEAKKAQREKALEEMHKLGREIGVDEERLRVLESKKEEQDFENYITDNVNSAEKMVRDYEIAKRKAYKEGVILESTPYPDVIEIYKNLREKVYTRGWREQAEVFANQIKIYQEKLDKHKKLLEVETKKAQREKALEDMHKVGIRKTKPAKPEKIMEIEVGEKEEDNLLDMAMNLIDLAEKEVKSYELSIRKDILVYESPYDKAISNYEKAREIFQKIGWNDEASRLINTIKFYKDKKEKDEILREIEQKKLEEPKVKLEATEIETEKDFLERQKRLLEFEEKQKGADEIAVEIFNMIQGAERMAQEYELKIKSGVFDYNAPYEEIIEIYREARKQFEKIGWKDESAKLKNTIQFYKEKLIKDKKIRALEAEKVKKREEELMLQQRLLEQARLEQEKLFLKRKKSLDLKKERVALFETQKDKAFRLMDQAKRELRQNNFDKAIEIYKESEEIFGDIKWQEGIKMVQDSIAMITQKKKAFELQQKAREEKKVEELLIEEKLEEQLAAAEIVKKRQQEEKRKEFIKIQREKEQERQFSEEAYELLEEGTALMDRGKFAEAYNKYVAARELFQKISWQREVSRINNELLFKLKRERKQAEILEDIKVKKIEEEQRMTLLKEEARKKRKELEKQKIEEKRRLAKEELDRQISAKLNKAIKLIENFRYNEGVLMMKEEIQRLDKLEKRDDINKIYDQIDIAKTEADVPLIVLEAPFDELQDKVFKSAYIALDKAQVSLSKNHLMKAVSELNEAKFKLKDLKIGKKFIKEIDDRISKLKTKISKKPLELENIKKEAVKEETELLRERIAARREERRKKVLDLLKKNRE
ncbi:MAG: hypothetical protein ACFFCL_03580 [Promethearchaeota archaeon]